MDKDGGEINSTKNRECESEIRARVRWINTPERPKDKRGSGTSQTPLPQRPMTVSGDAALNSGRPTRAELEAPMGRDQVRPRPEVVSARRVEDDVEIVTLQLALDPHKVTWKQMQKFQRSS
jgi:hypothetical protein